MGNHNVVRVSEAVPHNRRYSTHETAKRKMTAWEKNRYLTLQRQGTLEHVANMKEHQVFNDLELEVQSFSVPILVLDTSLNIIFVSSPCESILGVQRDYIFQNHLSNCLDNISCEILQQIIDRASWSGSSIELEYTSIEGYCHITGILVTLTLSQLQSGNLVLGVKQNDVTIYNNENMSIIYNRRLVNS
jgi:PAS domain-containing protein